MENNLPYNSSWFVIIAQPINIQNNFQTKASVVYFQVTGIQSPSSYGMTMHLGT